MGKELTAMLGLIVAACVLIAALWAYAAGRNATAVIVERQCLLHGGFKANGTDFKCERRDQSATL